MNFFSTICGKIEKNVFDDGFHQERRSWTSKLVLVMYCLSGGFCFHHNVQKKFQKIWIAYNTFNFIFIYVSCLYYLFNISVKDYYNLLLPIPAMCGVLLKFFIYLWIFLTRDLFSKLIDFCSDNEEEKKYKLFYTIRLRKREVTIISMICCFVFTFSMCNNLENFVQHKDYISIIFRFVQIVALMPEMFLFISFPTLLCVTSIKVHHRFELLSLVLRDTSYSVFRCLDEVRNVELAIEEKRIPGSLSAVQELKIRKALALDELIRKVVIVIEKHQELYTIAKQYAENLEKIFSIMYAEVFLTTIAEFFFISWITDEIRFQQSLTLLSILFGVFLCWLLSCFIGQLFQNMNEIIASEIYESPWYYLQPKDRRLIFTYLTIIQQPISVVVYKLYEVNLSLFPDILNTIYSQVQILRTLQLAQNRRH